MRTWEAWILTLPEDDSNIWYTAGSRRGETMVGGWMKALCEKAGKNHYDVIIFF